MDEDSVTLGNCIKLSGFKDSDPGELIVVKKIVGHFVEKYSNNCETFKMLEIRKKDIHKQEHSQKFEMRGKLIEDGKTHSVSDTDFNLFVALDGVLKKLEVILNKQKN